MGANTLLNTSSVEEECGGAIFSEVLSFLYRYCQLFSVRYSHVDSDIVSYFQRGVLTFGSASLLLCEVLSLFWS